jgi:hypothetical protein
MYRIVEIRYNTDVHLKHPSFGTFDVSVELTRTHRRKWLSIPHDLFFDYIATTDLQLADYINAHDFPTWADVIDDLESLGVDLQEQLLLYIHTWYSEQTFVSLVEYNPDEL